jgi:glutamate/tyrosine decarboxylase-like PLP-dependent enzyme
MTTTQERNIPIEISADQFRELGHQLVDQIADLFATLPQRRVTPGESPGQVRGLLGHDPLPQHGADPADLLNRATTLLVDHSTFNGHPRFLGYVTAPPAPIGVLADLLASAVNPNVGAGILSPMASVIEEQTVRWVAELLGYPTDCGGLLVSGGNMANFVPFIVARRAKTPWDVCKQGMSAGSRQLRAYVSGETHTWIHKAADLFGLGTEAIRWIPTDDQQRMDMTALRAQIDADLSAGDLPFFVAATAGTVSTGAVDPLPAIAALCREYDLWFHVDGAYGAPAAVLPDAPPDIYGLREADSVAVDPHKWLYMPLEAGCVLVRDRVALRDAFSYTPAYYHFDEHAPDEAPFTNFYEYGMQNSRGFRALKVWLALQHVGREGYVQMIGDDVRLAQSLYEQVAAHPRFEARTLGLSIATFRYIPEGFDASADGAQAYLNKLNEALLSRLQNAGEVFVSNAVIKGSYYLRACIVNFRTTQADIDAIPAIIARTGAAVDAELRSK